MAFAAAGQYLAAVIFAPRGTTRRWDGDKYLLFSAILSTFGIEPHRDVARGGVRS